MRRYQDPMPFSPQYDFVVAKGFTYNGVQYSGGEKFPPDDMDAADMPDENLLEKLYRQRRIQVAAPRPQETLTPNATVESLQGTQNDDTSGNDDQSPQNPDGGGKPSDDGAGAVTGDNQGGGSEQVGDTTGDGAGSGEHRGDDGAGGDAGSGDAGGSETGTADGDATVTDGKPTAPEGKAKRVNEGFGNFSVVAENGFVIASGLTKAQADAQVKAHNAA